VGWAGEPVPSIDEKEALLINGIKQRLDEKDFCKRSIQVF
jgi:hypothetical protein